MAGSLVVKLIDAVEQNSEEVDLDVVVRMDTNLEEYCFYVGFSMTPYF